MKVKVIRRRVATACARKAGTLEASAGTCTNRWGTFKCCFRFMPAVLAPWQIETVRMGLHFSQLTASETTHIMLSVRNLYSFWRKCTLFVIVSRNILFWFFEFKRRSVERGTRRKCYWDDTLNRCSSTFAKNTVDAALATVTNLVYTGCITASAAAFFWFRGQNIRFFSVPLHHASTFLKRATNTRLKRLWKLFSATDSLLQKRTLAVCCRASCAASVFTEAAGV